MTKDIKKEDLKKLILVEKLSYKEISKIYGVSTTSIHRIVKSFGLNSESRSKRKEIKIKDIVYSISDSEFICIVKNSLSIAEISRNLNVEVNTSSYRHINKRIEDLNIDISHFTGAAWNVGDRYKPIPNPKSKPLGELLVKGSNYGSFKLKNRLLKEGLKEYVCEECGLTVWNEKPIPLELHHIDGDRTNNTLENLKILCPNCHAQTDNYCGKNIKKTRKKNI